MWTFLIVITTIGGFTVYHVPSPVNTISLCNDMRDGMRKNLEKETFRTLYVGPCEPSHRLHQEKL